LIIDTSRLVDSLDSQGILDFGQAACRGNLAVVMMLY